MEDYEHAIYMWGIHVVLKTKMEFIRAEMYEKCSMIDAAIDKMNLQRSQEKKLPKFPSSEWHKEFRTAFSEFDSAAQSYMERVPEYVDRCFEYLSKK